MTGNLVLILIVRLDWRKDEEEELGEKKDEEDKTLETEISCVYFHLSSITPRTLLVKKLPVN